MSSELRESVDNNEERDEIRRDELGKYVSRVGVDLSGC